MEDQEMKTFAIQRRLGFHKEREVVIDIVGGRGLILGQTLIDKVRERGIIFNDSLINGFIQELIDIGILMYDPDATEICVSDLELNIYQLTPQHEREYNLNKLGI